MSFASLSSSLERKDRLRVSLLKSSNDVQRLFPKTHAASLSAAALHELTALASALEKLEDLRNFVSNEAKPPTYNSVFWGLIGHVVYVPGNLRFRPRSRF